MTRSNPYDLPNGYRPRLIVEGREPVPAPLAVGDHVLAEQTSTLVEQGVLPLSGIWQVVGIWAWGSDDDMWKARLVPVHEGQPSYSEESGDVFLGSGARPDACENLLLIHTTDPQGDYERRLALADELCIRHMPAPAEEA